MDKPWKTALDESREDVIHYHDLWKAAEAREARLKEEVERLRDADALLTRWGKLRVEYAALRGRQDHPPTHEESVAAWARMTELETEMEQAYLAIRMASDARGIDPRIKAP